MLSGAEWSLHHIQQLVQLPKVIIEHGTLTRKLSEFSVRGRSYGVALATETTECVWEEDALRQD